MDIISLARDLLTPEDYPIVDYLYDLISNEKTRTAWSLLQNIFPKYWTCEGGLRTLWPDEIYRPLYYLDNASQYIDSTRSRISYMGEHLEGLLYYLDEPKKLSLGRQIHRLKKKNYF